MSQQATLYEALPQSGQLFRTTTAVNGNTDLTEVHAVLVDWNWLESALLDAATIRYTLQEIPADQGPTKQNSLLRLALLAFLKNTKWGRN
jgi:hypothetical protein